ncbi:MAG: hypothetical protein RBT39_01815 [Azoarcus sp.]|nr:hypothetical protein [Azoarcus sp.]MDD2874258.1 hypothetical protein [Azoarcus sp.]MDX9836283.1 hypothetical protein [Azoarcus sp.]
MKLMNRISSEARRSADLRVKMDMYLDDYGKFGLTGAYTGCTPHVCESTPEWANAGIAVSAMH